jgi:hypothetical protein
MHYLNELRTIKGYKENLIQETAIFETGLWEYLTGLWEYLTGLWEYLTNP